MTQLYLIRHASGGRLSELGVRQAERLRDRLAATGEIRADVLISSTLLRASQTAELVAPALGLPTGTPWSWTTSSSSGTRATRPSSRAVGPRGRPQLGRRPPRGARPRRREPAAFTRRVSRALARITAEHAGRRSSSCATGA